MPEYKFSSGAVTAAKRVTATDVFTQNSDGAEIEVLQPAGTILTEVIVRFTKTSVHGSGADAGYSIGTASSGTQLGTNTDGFLDGGTGIPANSVYFLRTGTDSAGDSFETTSDAASPAAAAGYTDTDRTLYFAFTHTDVAVTTNNDAEVNFVFTHLN